VSASESRSCAAVATHHIHVFALEFFQELGKTLLIGVNPDGLENTLDIRFGGVAVASNAEKKVSCEVLHFGMISTLVS
jgi:hypothetical protein